MFAETSGDVRRSDNTEAERGRLVLARKRHLNFIDKDSKN
jgi:hypothetical protein